MNITIECVAFPGFYGSLFDEDGIERSERKNLAYEMGELQHLNDWGLSKDYRNQVCQEYIRRYMARLNEELGLRMETIGYRLRSPMEYNFLNDKIYMDVEVGDYDELISKLSRMMDDPQYRTQLAGVIKTKHASRSGFWSWMSSDIEEWYGIIVDPNKSHYVSYLLWYLYCLKVYGDVDREASEEITDEVYEYLSCNGDAMMLEPTTEEAQDEYEAYLEQKQYREMLNHWPAIPGLFKD